VHRHTIHPAALEEGYRVFMNESIRRKVGRTVAPLLVLAVSALASAQAAWEWRDVQQYVRILANGDVDVYDTRTLWTDGDFGEAFLCVWLSEGQSLTMLGATGAVSPGPPAVGLTQPCDGGTEVVVRQGERVSERRVRFAYRLHGTLEHVGDSVRWWWTILEGNRPEVRDYLLVVEASGEVEAPSNAFVDIPTSSTDQDVWRSRDSRTLLVRLSVAASGDVVTVRILMDPALFPRAGTEAGSDGPLVDHHPLPKGR
jgi:hypothetical protein